MTDNYKILQEQHDRYIYARDEGHLKFQRKAKKCEEFVAGDQWDQLTKQRLEAVRRPALTLNKTLSSMMVLFSEQLRNRASVNYVPSSGAGDQHTANVLNKLWLHIAQSNNLRWVESQVFDDGVITGRGFFDIRMDFSEHVLGDIAITHMNPMNVIIDPDAEEYDPDNWSDVFYSKWLSIDDIARIYGRSKANQVRDASARKVPLGYDYYDERPDTFGGYEYSREAAYYTQANDYRRRVRVLERQYKKVEQQEHFVDLETGDMSVIPEGMPREKIKAIIDEFNVAVIKKPVDVYWWTVTAADVILHHAESPYKHFTVVPFFPVFRRGRTIGMVENLIDPQELYNKARSQELHVINTSANSGWVLRKGAVLNMTTEELEERGAETGLVLEVDDVNNIDKIKPNPIPTGLDRVSYTAGEDLKEISMASDSMRGFDREDVAAKAIQAKQRVGGKNFAKIMDNLAHTRTLLASRALDLMQTFYTTEREFQITGEGLRPQTETIRINQPVPADQLVQPANQPVTPLAQSEVPPAPAGLAQGMPSHPQPVEPSPAVAPSAGQQGLTTQPPAGFEQVGGMVPPAGQGPAGEYKPVLNDITVGKYSVVVTTVPDRDTMQQTNFEQAVQLRELGVPIPDKVLIENSTLENKEELLEDKPDPVTQQQQLIELESKRAELEKIQAEIQKIKSDAALNLVRAGRDASEVENPQPATPATQPTQPATAVDPSKLREIALKERELKLKEKELQIKAQLQAQELALKQASEKAKNIIELRKIEQAPASAGASPASAGNKQAGAGTSTGNKQAGAGTSASAGNK